MVSGLGRKYRPAPPRGAENLERATPGLQPLRLRRAPFRGLESPGVLPAAPACDTTLLPAVTSFKLYLRASDHSLGASGCWGWKSEVKATL